MSATVVGIRDEIRELLTDSTAGLSSRDIFQKSQLATNRKQISNALYNMKKEGLIVLGSNAKYRIMDGGQLDRECFGPGAIESDPGHATPLASDAAKLIFDEVLDGLLEAVAEIEDTSLRVLAGMVKRHRPRHSS